MKYQSETNFQITEDNRMIYNLRQDGFKKGQPIMVNDIAVTIEARHLPIETQIGIAKLIKMTLDANYGI
jgi:hypothetical protein